MTDNHRNQPVLLYFISTNNRSRAIKAAVNVQLARLTSSYFQFIPALSILNEAEDKVLRKTQCDTLLSISEDLSFL